MGIAGSLLDAATNEALRGDLRLILDDATHFGAAIELYEGLGWTCIGRVTVRIRDEAPLDELVYLGPADRCRTRAAPGVTHGLSSGSK